jgi:hypothetical protein
VSGLSGLSGKSGDCGLGWVIIFIMYVLWAWGVKEFIGIVSTSTVLPPLACDNATIGPVPIVSCGQGDLCSCPAEAGDRTKCTVQKHTVPPVFPGPELGWVGKWESGP